MRKILFVLGLLLLACPANVWAAWYACGTFQAWNPSQAQEFTLDTDGMYRLDIDFSGDVNFKVSTTRPDATLGPQEQWGAFDQGSRCITDASAMYVGLKLSAGDQNIKAPVQKKLTVVINPELDMIGFTDGAKEIAWTQSGPGPVGAALYACGAFNGWKPQEAVEFTVGDDGIYSCEIDFTSGTSFKLSTVRPQDGPDAWTEFNASALKAATNPAMYEPVALVKGIDNSEAPAAQRLTVLVNPKVNKIAFTDGGQQINWNYIPASWSGSLPVLFINTEGGAPVVTKETYLKGTYYLDPMGDSSIKAIGSAEEPLPLQIKGRGNYTWFGFDKKPYRLKLDAKAALMGMNKSKHFGLLAHADDNRGFLRNTVGFELARRIGLEWTSSDKPVELVLNGEYLGLYFLTELIRVDKDRVNVFEQPDGDKSTDVTGGWLVEIDNYDTDPHVEFYGDDNHRRIFTYKTPEALNQAQEQWLYNQMRTIDHLVFDRDKTNAKWLDYVDLDELVKFYIVQELMDNYESFVGSCYIHRDVDNAELAADGQATHKWKFGPVWDFGSAYFRQKHCYIYQDGPYSNAWIEQMCQFPQFMDAVMAKWSSFYNGSYGDMDAFIDDFANRIDAAAKLDYKRWPQYGNSDVKSKAADIKNWLRTSSSWLDSKWKNSGLESLNVAAVVPAVEVIDGRVVITSEAPATIVVARIDGSYNTVSVAAGTTVLDLPAGFYIIAGKKVMI